MSVLLGQTSASCFFYNKNVILCFNLGLTSQSTIFHSCQASHCFLGIYKYMYSGELMCYSMTLSLTFTLSLPTPPRMFKRIYMYCTQYNYITFNKPYNISISGHLFGQQALIILNGDICSFFYQYNHYILQFINKNNVMILSVCLYCGLTSQSTIFQSCKGGVITS